MAKSDKIWPDAIRRAVNRYKQETDGEGNVHKVKYLNVLADNVVRMAAEGDMQAMKEIGDRIDGKPTQTQQIDMKVSNDVASFLGTIGVGAPTPERDEVEDGPSSVRH